MENRNKFEGVNSIKFNKYFQSDNDCYRYLSEIKWGSDDPYLCKRCSHTKYGRVKKPYSRRCAKCNYDESPTGGTMFDKLKFSLLIAFHTVIEPACTEPMSKCRNIVFKISTKEEGMSSLELSEEFEIRQMTVWQFKWKIQQAMSSSKCFPLTGEVHIDEFLTGEYEEGKKGRSLDSKKKQVVVALEILGDDGVGRAYAQVIENASAKEFKPFFNNYISKEAKAITDVWKGYLPLKKDYPNLKQIPSNKGKNFKQLHIHIMNIQGWLRGIHHHCTKERLQGYLDEYHFRYNRRNNMGTIFDMTIRRMVINKPVRLKYSKLNTAN
jgi:hypothetical protein